MHIVNTVYTANLNKVYNLRLVNDIIYKSIYKPHKFSGLIFKANESSITLFSNGKLNILGCKTEKRALKITKKVAKILDGNLSDFKLRNLIVTESIGNRLNLNKLGEVF